MNDNLPKAITCHLDQIPEATPMKQQLYNHITPISKPFQLRRTGYAGHCWKRNNEFMS